LNKYENFKVCRFCQILGFVLKNYYNFESFQNMLTIWGFCFLYHKLALLYMSCTLYPIYMWLKTLENLRFWNIFWISKFHNFKIVSAFWMWVVGYYDLIIIIIIVCTTWNDQHNFKMSNKNICKKIYNFQHYLTWFLVPFNVFSPI